MDIDLEPWEIRHRREQQELLNYRGRRLRACCAVDDLCRIIDAIGIEDGSVLPLPGAPPPLMPNGAHKAEMKNTAANLLRTILLWNDGQISPQRLQRF